MYVLVEGGLGAHAKGVSNIIGKYEPAMTRENQLPRRAVVYVNCQELHAHFFRLLTWNGMLREM
jgi:hypothetical protein